MYARVLCDSICREVCLRACSGRDNINDRKEIAAHLVLDLLKKCEQLPPSRRCTKMSSSRAPRSRIGIDM